MYDYYFVVKTASDAHNLPDEKMLEDRHVCVRA
jgi:hypothetical protein